MGDRKSFELPSKFSHEETRVLASFSVDDIKFQVLPLGFYHEGSRPVANLAAASACKVSGPIEPGSPGNWTELTCPPIQARRFDNTEAVECSSALVRRKHAYIPDFCEEHKDTLLFDGVFLARQSIPKRLALMLEGVRPRAWNGIMLFHVGATNWYHWLIEILPMAFLAERLPREYAIHPFVIPEKIAQLRNFRASLELFLNGRKVVSINEKGFRFNELIVIDPIANGPFNLEEGVWPAKEMYTHNRDLLIEYRNTILDRLSIQKRARAN